MADLFVDCYGALANDGNYQCPDRFLGQVNITTLSSTSQSASLPTGTRFVELATDATEMVYVEFGEGSATATTASQRLFAAQSQTSGKYLGINGKTNDTIAARIA
jgi:hypothetical protein